MPDSEPPLRYRPFQVGDAPMLSSWLRQAGMGVPSSVGDQAWARRVLDDPKIDCWAAVSGDWTVGFLRLDTGPDRGAELTLIVRPELCRQGIGQAMVDQALAWARRQGLRRLLAVVQDSNSAAQAFFSAQGFEPNGTQIPGFVHMLRLVHRAGSQPPLEIHP